MGLLIRLRRRDTSTPWGFRMNGGVEFNQPLFIQRVNPQSLAMKSGLQPGDGILQIGPSSTQNMSHEQAKMEIIRSGNELDFIVQRNMVTVDEPVIDYDAIKQAEATQNYVTYKSGPAQNPDAQSRSFKVIQQQLAE